MKPQSPIPSRRDLLQIGGLGAFGLGLGDLFQLQAASPTRTRESHFGRAKACILLFPYGSPPQHETFDPKPQAPAEVQGELKAISTAVPGLAIGEGLPNVARVMDRVTIIRSMTHRYPDHGVAYAVSGIPTYTPALETAPRDPRHWPFIGSIVDYVDAKRTGNPAPELPRNIGLPWLLNSRTDLNVSAGPYAAFLGQGFDPAWAEFHGAGTRIAPKYTDGQTKEFLDPFAGCSLDGRFRLSTASPPATDVGTDRLSGRRDLLARFDQARGAAHRIGDAGGFDQFRERAFSLIASGKMREALDIGRESPALRDRYGATLFGQSCLCARRLVEAGSRFVTVFWDGFGQFANCAWDTHNNHYPRLKEYLLPGLDRAYSALLLDLADRGMLDDTLVVWMSEHGRTPRIDPVPKGAGRHHWSRVYSVAMAGGGTAAGATVGSSDKHGGDVSELPISPKDILATTLHLLGIDPDTTVTDSQGRPARVVGEGRVRKEVFG